MGREIEVKVDDREETTLNVYYPKLYNIDYIKPHVSLEIGPLAAWSPSEKIFVTPYVGEEMPQIFSQKSTDVLTVKPERTFWEKATILHREANRKPESRMPIRYSRHYYDLYQFGKSVYAERALKDRKLLETVVNFKQKFYACGWAEYEECLNGNFKLIPPEYRFTALKQDYLQMQEMIYGVVPTFDEILQSLEELEKLINRQK